MTSGGHTIRVTPYDAELEVRLNGELLAKTSRPLRLEETGLPARYYVPRDDVRMELLRSTSFHTTCPFKGEASYWTLKSGDRESAEVAVVVVDDWQNQGVGTALLDRLTQRARENGIVLYKAIVSADNFDGAVEVVRACPAVHAPGAALEIRELSGAKM